jgi:hypothetical protein
MITPGMNAELSLGRAHQYDAFGAPCLAHHRSILPQLRCLPPGLCSKAFNLCRNPGDEEYWIESRPPRGPWCAIADRCMTCYMEN